MPTMNIETGKWESVCLCGKVIVGVFSHVETEGAKWAFDDDFNHMAMCGECAGKTITTKCIVCGKEFSHARDMLGAWACGSCFANHTTALCSIKPGEVLNMIINNDSEVKELYTLACTAEGSADLNLTVGERIDQLNDESHTCPDCGKNTCEGIRMSHYDGEDAHYCGTCGKYRPCPNHQCPEEYSVYHYCKWCQTGYYGPNHECGADRFFLKNGEHGANLVDDDELVEMSGGGLHFNKFVAVAIKIVPNLEKGRPTQMLWKIKEMKHSEGFGGKWFTPEKEIILRSWTGGAMVGEVRTGIIRDGFGVDKLYLLSKHKAECSM